MTRLIKIDRFLINSDAIEYVAPTKVANNDAVTLFLRGGQNLSFGMTMERFRTMFNSMIVEGEKA